MNADYFMNIFATESGWVAASWSSRGLIALTLPQADKVEALTRLLNETPLSLSHIKPIIQADGFGEQVHRQISMYFAGKNKELNLPVDWSFYTDFQQKILQAVQGIPYGQVCSYRQVGEAVGMPRAARAVGGAVGSNRVLLVIPCHRVVRQDGSIGGFGSGLEWKSQLLSLEGCLPNHNGKYILNQIS